MEYSEEDMKLINLLSGDKQRWYIGLLYGIRKRLHKDKELLRKYNPNKFRELGRGIKKGR